MMNFDLDQYDAILWDFDGVLMNSNAIRDVGFEKVLALYPPDQVHKLMTFHRANGGLSRYVKFRYFFEQIRNEVISDAEVQKLASDFSSIMLGLLLNPALLIQETLNFVEHYSATIPMHIVSGSDQVELRYICSTLKIAGHFHSIHGSPTPKKELVRDVLLINNYDKERCVLIGDSINDYEAARANGIGFMAYNNDALNIYNTAVINF
jgi:phosphoglycolate phosphatase-like HAD superfamily hydrolase